MYIQWHLWLQLGAYFFLLSLLFISKAAWGWEHCGQLRGGSDIFISEEVPGEDENILGGKSCVASSWNDQGDS